MTDAIVIGGGPNGLTVAACLARSGASVVVVEKRSDVGGIASTYEFAPGFRASIGPENCGLLLPQVLAELELERHGLELLAPEALSFVPSREGAGLLLWNDVNKSVEEIRKVSAKDAESYPRFVSLVGKLCEFLKPLLSKPAPRPEVESGSDLLDLLRLGWGFRQLGARSMHELLRVVPMALHDFLNEWFDSDLLKAALGAPALEGVALGPRSAGTAALFLYQRLQDRKVARGGAGGVSQALLEAFKAHRGALRTGAAVERILVENGRASGVVLDSGETLKAPLVLSSLAPRNTFKKLLEPTVLGPSFLLEVDGIRYRGVTAKVHFALKELPDFTCRPGTTVGPHHRAVVHVGGSLDAYERAYDASKYGEPSRRPLLSVSIPSLSDRSLAPEGKCVVSVIAQWAPYRLRHSSWSDAKEDFVSTVLDTLAEVAPNVKGAVLHQDCWTPLDYERELGLPEGSWHQGEMALDQMFFMRPVPGWSRYETPVEGLFLCGSATHPGGGITGACGYNCAQRILKDR